MLNREYGIITIAIFPMLNISIDNTKHQAIKEILYMIIHICVIVNVVFQG